MGGGGGSGGKLGNFSDLYFVQESFHLKLGQLHLWLAVHEWSIPNSTSALANPLSINTIQF